MSDFDFTKKIGKQKNGTEWFPNLFSAIVNRRLRKIRRAVSFNELGKLLEYAREVEKRYNGRFKRFSIS